MIELFDFRIAKTRHAIAVSAMPNNHAPSTQTIAWAAFPHVELDKNRDHHTLEGLTIITMQAEQNHAVGLLGETMRKHGPLAPICVSRGDGGHQVYYSACEQASLRDACTINIRALACVASSSKTYLASPLDSAEWEAAAEKVADYTLLNERGGHPTEITPCEDACRTILMYRWLMSVLELPIAEVTLANPGTARVSW